MVCTTHQWCVVCLAMSFLKKYQRSILPSRSAVPFVNTCLWKWSLVFLFSFFADNYYFYTIWRIIIVDEYVKFCVQTDFFSERESEYLANNSRPRLKRTSSESISKRPEFRLMMIRFQQPLQRQKSINIQGVVQKVK